MFVIGWESKIRRKKGWSAFAEQPFMLEVQT